MSGRRVSILLFTFLLGCSPRSCPKSPPPPQVCLEGDAGASAQPKLDEEAVKALEERLAKLRKGGRKTVRYRAPSLEEERAYTGWVRDALVAAMERKEPPRKAPEGFSLRVMGDLWILEEARKKKRGAGALVIRTGRAKPILVEAPHTFFDKGTLPIALDVFEAQSARVLLINTVHRYIDKPKPSQEKADNKDKDKTDKKGGEGEEADDEAALEKEEAADEKADDSDDDKAPDLDEIDDPDAGIEVVASDVAHAESSYFLAAHREIVALLHDNVTVQLHGFRDEKVPDVGVIVSASKGPGDAVGLSQRLTLGLPEVTVWSYPQQAKTLGGTTNAQARASREMSAPFFHIEIARSLRDKMAEDKPLRARFAAALDPFLPTNPTAASSK